MQAVVLIENEEIIVNDVDRIAFNVDLSTGVAGLVSITLLKGTEAKGFFNIENIKGVWLEDF